MPLISDCPGCGRRVRVPDSLLGKGVQCPSCGTSFIVDGSQPGGEGQEPGQPAPAPPPEGGYVAEPPRQRAPAPPAEDYEPWDDGADEGGRRRRRRGGRASDSVMPPAIFLLVVGVLGLMAALFNAVGALVLKPPPVDPNAPEFLQEIQKGGFGPTAAAIQCIWVVANLVIIVAAVQMMRLRTYGLAVAGSILAMINLGTLCCILGLPAGIWSLVVLLRQDVKDAFR